MLHAEGLENVFARHARHGEATRAAVRAWGLEVLCLDEREHSGALTAVVMPDGYDADELRRIVLERFDMSLGAGLGKVAGRVFRIGHLGDFNDLMLAGTLCGVEMGLRLAGVPLADSGVEAALARLEGERAGRRRVSALAGLRVLELTQVMAGPFCGQVLADMGADVVKVEPPSGDSTRRSLGFTMQGDDTAAFLAVNRNKRSLVLDLKDPAPPGGARAAGARAPTCCWRTTGRAWRRGSARTGRRCRARNPRLIYASVSGFGQTGPYAQRPGYDLIAQGLSGVMSVTGEPGGDPVKCGIPIGDLSAGLFCAVGILSALHARERTGRGQRIDTSLFEGALALSIWETAELWATGRVPAPLGSAHRLTAPYQALRTADGYMTVGGNNQRLWERLCDGDRARRSWSTTRASRRTPTGWSAARELEAELEAALAARGTDEWVAAAGEAGVPCGPIHDYAQVFADEHTQARAMEVRGRASRRGRRCPRSGSR